MASDTAPISASRARATGAAPAVLPLRTENLVKKFRQGAEKVTALNGVSLDIQPGQFVAIMGPSGCGKSTLLHVMAGLTRPDSGHVAVEGENLSTLSDARLTDFRRRRIGLVFQQFNLVSALTALENVTLPLLAEGGRDRRDLRDRAAGLLDQLGLKHRLDHRPDAMSGGEQQRVAIARALVADPAIILADEPTGSLDSANGNTICALLKRLNEDEQRTIVMVTHEPAVASWAGRTVVMKDGSVCCEWTAEQVPDAQTLAARYQEIVAAPVMMRN